MAWAYIGQQVSGAGPEGSLQFHTTLGQISGSEKLLYNSTSNTLILSGNLYVSGTTTTISSSELVVIDKHIRLAASSSASDLAVLITAGDPPSIQFGTASAIPPSEAPFEIQLFSSSYSDQISGSGFSLLRSGSTFSLEGTQQYASLRVNALSASGDIFTAGGLSASTITGDGSGITGIVGPTGTPVDNQVAVWTDATTLEGASSLTYDGSKLSVTGEVSASTALSASGLKITGPGLDGGVGVNAGDSTVFAGSFSTGFLSIGPAGSDNAVITRPNDDFPLRLSSSGGVAITGTLEVLSKDTEVSVLSSSMSGVLINGGVGEGGTFRVATNQNPSALAIHSYASDNFIAINEGAGSITTTIGTYGVGTGILLNDGGVSVNSDKNQHCNFAVHAQNKSNAIFVDSSEDQVLFFTGSTPEFGTGADTNFFVSGTIGSRATAVQGTADFGGDVHVSGGLYVEGEITGSNVSASAFYLTEDHSIFFDGSTENFKINNSGQTLNVVGATVNLNGNVTCSAELSASAGITGSAFWVGPPGEELQIFHSPSLGGNILLKAHDGNLILETEATDKKIFARLGSDNSNTSFQVRNASSTALFTVDAAGTMTHGGEINTVTVTASSGIQAADLLIDTSASVNSLSASSQISASAFEVGVVGSSLLMTSNAAIGGNILKSWGNHLIIENEASNKHIFARLGSDDGNTSFQVRNASNSTLFKVNGAGTMTHSGEINAVTVTASSGIQAADLLIDTSASVGTTLDVGGDLSISGTVGGGEPDVSGNPAANFNLCDTDARLLRHNTGAGDTLSLKMNNGTVALSASSAIQLYALDGVNTSVSVLDSTLYVKTTNPAGPPTTWVSLNSHSQLYHLKVSGSETVPLQIGPVADGNPSIVISGSTLGTAGRATIRFAESDGAAGYIMGRGFNADTNDFYLHDPGGVGSVMYISTTGQVGLGTTSPTAHLHVSSSHTEHLFRVDSAAGAVGGTDTTGSVLFVTGSRIDLASSASAHTGKVGIGFDAPRYPLEVFQGASIYPAISITGSTHLNSLGRATMGFGTGNSSGYIMGRFNNDNKFYIYNTQTDLHGFVIDNAGKTAINNGTPLTALDVHHTGGADPVTLGNDTGGGDIVYFGSASAALNTGALYYLNTLGGWVPAAAWATGSISQHGDGGGHQELLGIALGSDPMASGMLIKGFYDVNSYLSGAFIMGGPVYIGSSSTGENGFMSGAAPTTGDSFVRVVGYGTDTANVIYFNPSTTYVELTAEEE